MTERIQKELYDGRLNNELLESQTLSVGDIDHQLSANHCEDME